MSEYDLFLHFFDTEFNKNDFEYIYTVHCSHKYTHRRLLWGLDDATPVIMYSPKYTKPYTPHNAVLYTISIFCTANDTNWTYVQFNIKWLIVYFIILRVEWKSLIKKIVTTDRAKARWSMKICRIRAFEIPKCEQWAHAVANEFNGLYDHPDTLQLFVYSWSTKLILPRTHTRTHSQAHSTHRMMRITYERTTARL